MQCCEAYKPVCKVSVYCIVVYALRSVYEGPEVHISSPSCSLRRKLSTNRPAPSPALVLAVSPISSICYCTCLPRRRLEVHRVMFIVGKCTALCPPPPSLCEVYSCRPELHYLIKLGPFGAKPSPVCRLLLPSKARLSFNHHLLTFTFTLSLPSPSHPLSTTSEYSVNSGVATNKRYTGLPRAQRRPPLSANTSRPVVARSLHLLSSSPREPQQPWLTRTSSWTTIPCSRICELLPRTLHLYHC